MTKENSGNAPLASVTIDITGPNGNAFYILCELRRILHEAEYDEDSIEAIMKRATSDDYEHLLAVAGEFVRIVRQAR